MEKLSNLPKAPKRLAAKSEQYHKMRLRPYGAHWGGLAGTSRCPRA